MRKKRNQRWRIKTPVEFHKKERIQEYFKEESKVVHALFRLGLASFTKEKQGWDG